jgi:hypothetical protein
VAVLAHQRVGILYRYGQTHASHHRQVDHIVADVGGLLLGNAEFLQQFLERRQFIQLSLVDMRDAEILHAVFDHPGGATGDNGDLDALAKQHLDAVPVARMKRLVFLAVIADVQAAVGEHAVDVEYHQADTGCLLEYVFHQCRFRFLKPRRLSACHACSARQRACWRH